jgi:hypothetical protein
LSRPKQRQHLASEALGSPALFGWRLLESWTIFSNDSVISVVRLVLAMVSQHLAMKIARRGFLA